MTAAVVERGVNESALAARRQLTPTDADYDDMHHALGRPDGPWVTPYRNAFVAGLDSPEAERFAILGSYWQLGRKINDGQDGVFFVTPHGQREVMAWLELRNRAGGKRSWLVRGGGVTPRVVIAKSASAAKYAVYLDIDGADHWGGFGGFLKSGVRASLAEASHA